jgi:hypothetical protein
MATAQVNGSALTDNGFGSFTEANNNHGTMKANGTATSNVVEGVTTPGPKVSVFASTVIPDSTTSVDYAGKAVSAGTFAYDNTKPLSSLITTVIAGVSSNAIKTPGNDPGSIRSINKVESNASDLFTTALRANKYNRTTGEWDSGYPALTTISFSTDDAATPTASVPGELTYMRGSKTPYNDNYKAKTNY